MKIIVILSDRNYTDELDKRKNPLSSKPDELSIFVIENSEFKHFRTSFYFGSLIYELPKKFEDIRTVPKRDFNRDLDKSSYDDFIKFIKRTPEHFMKEFNSWEEYAEAMDVSGIQGMYDGLNSTRNAITLLLKSLSKIEYSEKRYAYKDCILLNSGNYCGNRFRVIDNKRVGVFWAKLHYTHKTEIDVTSDPYISVGGFLRGSNYRDTYNREYEIYKAGAKVRKEFIEIVTEYDKMTKDYHKRAKFIFMNTLNGKKELV